MNFHDLFFNSRIGYLLQIVPFLLLTAAVFWLCRGCWLKRRGIRRSGILLEGLLVVFVCYLSGLAALICTPANFWGRFWYFVCYRRPGGELDPLFSGSFNLVPTLFKYLTGKYTGGSWTTFLFAGNALLFLPFGLLLPAVRPRMGLAKVLGLALAVSLAMELFQPIVGRSFDTDDLIMNTLGALIGYILYFILRSIFQKKEVKL